MKLPNSERAFVDIRKLRDYCLNPEHPVGKHKAYVFKSVLGLTSEDGEKVQEVIGSFAVTNDAEEADQDEYGKRFVVRFELRGPSGEATVVSSWIVRSKEDFPRLTSCYVDRRE